jgi:hypothetical protein
VAVLVAHRRQPGVGRRARCLVARDAGDVARDAGDDGLAYRLAVSAASANPDIASRLACGLALAIAGVPTRGIRRAQPPSLQAAMRVFSEKTSVTDNGHHRRFRLSLLFSLRGSGVSTASQTNAAAGGYAWGCRLAAEHAGLPARSGTRLRRVRCEPPPLEDEAGSGWSLAAWRMAAGYACSRERLLGS